LSMATGIQSHCFFIRAPWGAVYAWVYARHPGVGRIVACVDFVRVRCMSGCRCRAAGGAGRAGPVLSPVPRGDVWIP